MNLRTAFIDFYNQKFKQSILWNDMVATVENSPWHREANVGVHTDMVVNKYLELTQNVEWTSVHLCGALACVFHDVGKPAAKTEKFKPDRGNYVVFTGHEQISTRLFEDYVVENWAWFPKWFGNMFWVKDIYSVGWMVEHHLPYGITKRDKLINLKKTCVHLFQSSPEIFCTVLRADAAGRISDDHEAKLARVEDWIRDSFDSIVLMEETTIESAPTVYLLVGASGSGKSTRIKETDSEVFSLDAARLELYKKDGLENPVEAYRHAYQESINDKDFPNKANKMFMNLLGKKKNILVDNTNVSVKRRRFYAEEARKKGYLVRAVMFPVSLNQLDYRQQTRPDKHVPFDAVKQQYMRIQYPSIGEVDDVIVSDTNLIE